MSYNNDNTTSSDPGYYYSTTTSVPYDDTTTTYAPYDDTTTTSGPYYYDTTTYAPYDDTTTTYAPYDDTTTTYAPSFVETNAPTNVPTYVPTHAPTHAPTPSQNTTSNLFSTRQVVSTVLAISLFFIIARIFIFISDKYKTNINIIMLAGAVIFGLILFGLMYIVNTNIDNFHFELTPIKKCQGGPYMYSSDPERQKLCSHFNQQEYCEYNCGRGFVGAPVHWERSADSDSNWSNSEMTINDSYDYPQVL